MIEMANDRGLIRWELQPARRATIEAIDLAKVETYLRQRSTGSRQSGNTQPRGEDAKVVSQHILCSPGQDDDDPSSFLKSWL
jgi:hypothetical protein